jgi:hypothetical protein
VVLLAAILVTAGCAPVVAPRPTEVQPPPQPAPPPPIRSVEPGATVVGVASVIDGDTIEIHAQRIRLYGIDAPKRASRATSMASHGVAARRPRMRWPSISGGDQSPASARPRPLRAPGCHDRRMDRRGGQRAGSGGAVRSRLLLSDRMAFLEGGASPEPLRWGSDCKRRDRRVRDVHRLTETSFGRVLTCCTGRSSSS